MRRRDFLQQPPLVAASVALTTWGWPTVAGAQPASAAAEEAKAPPMPALGSVIRVPATERLNAAPFDPAQAAGQPLLLYWWASTCPFCALQSPAMEAFWREQRGRGLQMLGISIDRRREDAEAYLKKKGYTFPTTWATPAFKQALPKPKGLPITWLIGPDGHLKLAERGQMFAEDVQAMASLW